MSSVSPSTTGGMSSGSRTMGGRSRDAHESERWTASDPVTPRTVASSDAPTPMRRLSRTAPSHSSLPKNVAYHSSV
ncbi:hypothetical protein [Halobacterium sp. CBA1126]|uniref:hypothetical protein n=1 Tax=Halobacterium sp. CBA1126 TaxID=2668074 RepID=UPI001E433C70|nr:hypothetical protein [Halobacterium sp. CBA1126]